MKFSRYKRDMPFSYALGATLSYELLKTNPNLIRRVFLRPNIKHGDDLAKIINQLKAQNIDISESNKAFNVLGAKENCLLITEFDKPTSTLSYDTTTPQIALVNPSDTGNLGTIMRSAVAFGYQNIAIITPAVDAYDPKTIRASMGAVFHLNIQTFPSFDDYLESCTKNNPTSSRTLYSFMLAKTAHTLPQVTPQNKNYTLIFGNEASGLPADFATKTQPVFIPQSENVDSLNLSVAASIAMYHFCQK